MYLFISNFVSFCLKNSSIDTGSFHFFSDRLEHWFLEIPHLSRFFPRPQPRHPATATATATATIGTTATATVKATASVSGSGSGSGSCGEPEAGPELSEPPGLFFEPFCFLDGLAVAVDGWQWQGGSGRVAVGGWQWQWLGGSGSDSDRVAVV
jgi:hypothetical protein